MPKDDERKEMTQEELDAREEKFRTFFSSFVCRSISSSSGSAIYSKFFLTFFSSAGSASSVCAAAI